MNKLPLIYPAGVKKRIIEGLGIDRVEMVDFTLELSRMEPEQFLRDMLLRRFDVKYIVVGFNYRFGYRGSGDTDFLKGFGERAGVNVEVVDPVYVDGEIVSSSLIRTLLSTGDIKRANRCLGDNYRIIGEVVKGDGRGKEMGFPTANMMLPDGILYPARGVYISNTVYNNVNHSSITNVGIKPTFSGNKMVIETHLAGFKCDLYGKSIAVEFIDRIRNEKKFQSKEELMKQIELDLKYMENYLYRWQITDSRCQMEEKPAVCEL
jgi:riboflavin kinase/FMN adenylyltransferase